jgi:hypothetical protein
MNECPALAGIFVLEPCHACLSKRADLQQKGPDRNPGRVLNPISYEKPEHIISSVVPIAETRSG